MAQSQSRQDGLTHLTSCQSGCFKDPDTNDPHYTLSKSAHATFMSEVSKRPLETDGAVSWTSYTAHFVVETGLRSALNPTIFEGTLHVHTVLNVSIRPSRPLVSGPLPQTLPGTLKEQFNQTQTHTEHMLSHVQVLMARLHKGQGGRSATMESIGFSLAICEFAISHRDRLHYLSISRGLLDFYRHQQGWAPDWGENRWLRDTFTPPDINPNEPPPVYRQGKETDPGEQPPGYDS
ncbi:hypothetical protein TREMEDRAFT_65066 [Tremella mesenterica DSM 1558]|uniref:uncharacterized protein n=1 Tax=Tremella mesenterica (strain ATCC 24925 / CBS 8224 / DSM 1558 / NBRC 9311 / NRRL Y-6157 / RJB 2259-6 / UBC 559-6) TaxID=578456 RepID=UPI00032D3CF5|nr:uncharacterized protein TREMEDRAFT_65066 [Tremella mesenterica DSM 1558]EIW66675.1 hypothetical protein TREMEDRAFT_65066 [Tremella mesenterica DSM 1558]